MQQMPRPQAPDPKDRLPELISGAASAHRHLLDLVKSRDETKDNLARQESFVRDAQARYDECLALLVKVAQQVTS